MIEKKEPFRIAVLTTGRQDWGLLRPLVNRLVESPRFEVLLMAGGMACSPQYGGIAGDIRAKGYPLVRELGWDVENAPAHVQSAEALRAVGGALEELGPGALILLGDRFETAAAALAATVTRVPIVHLYGGEETEGAFDNALRYAITKLSHLHMVAHEVYARRVIQMGEDPETVHVVGSLGMDNIARMETPSKVELEEYLGVELRPPVGLVTVHPTTLSDDDDDKVARAVVEAIETLGGGTWVVTLPNADPGNEAIRTNLSTFAARMDKVVVAEALGEERYLGLMKECGVVLGNSSSGMIEAPALGVPTVNVGDRQKGRLRFPSIIDVPPDADRVVDAVKLILAEEFQERMASSRVILGDGHAAERIVELLEVQLPGVTPRKRFREISSKAQIDGTSGHRL